MTLTLPDWLYRGIVTKGGVLTIHEDYFLLTGGIERWLYRVARKHAGTQELGWQFTMRQLYEKSGSIARFSDFALDVRRVAQADRLPEYALTIHRTDEDEVVSLIPRIHLPVTDPRFRPPRNPRRRVALGMTEAASAFPAGPIRRNEAATNRHSGPASAGEDADLGNHQLSLPTP
jgi:plasmid replication initiation protein